MNKKVKIFLSLEPNDVWQYIRHMFEVDKNKTAIFVKAIAIFGETGKGLPNTNIASAIAAYDSYVIIEKNISSDLMSKIEDQYLKYVVRCDVVFTGDNMPQNIPQVSKNIDLISEASEKACSSVFLWRKPKDEVLNLLNNEKIQVAIIKGMMKGIAPFIYFSENRGQPFAPRKVYLAAFNAYRKIDIDKLDIDDNGVKLINREISSHNKNNFYFPFSIAAKIILIKRGLNIKDDFDFYKYRENVNTIDDLELDDSLNFFDFFDKRVELIKIWNEKQSRPFDIGSMLCIDKNEMDTIHEYRKPPIVHTITKDNFYKFKNIDINRLKSIEGTIDVINETKDLYDISNIVAKSYDFLGEIKETFSLENFKKITKEKKGAVLLGISNIDNNLAKDLLIADNFDSLDGWSAYIFKKDELTKEHVEHIINLFNKTSDDSKTVLLYGELINTKKGRILEHIYKSRFWKKENKELLQKLKSDKSDRFYWWLQGLRFVYGLKHEMPNIYKDEVTFINPSLELYKPSDTFYKNDRIMDIFLKLISDKDFNSEISINYVIIGILYYTELHGSKIVKAIQSNSKYELWPLLSVFTNEWNQKFEDAWKMLINYSWIRDKLALHILNFFEFSEEINGTTVPIAKAKKIIINSNLEIEPYKMHGISMFFARNIDEFTEQEIIEIFNKVKKGHPGELISGIGEDGIGQLLDVVSEGTQKKILVELKKMCETLPAKYLFRLNKLT